MKSSAHLFYGIIIGILLFACMGLSKKERAEFKEQRMLPLGIRLEMADEKLAKYKKEGWTIIDIETVVHDYGIGNQIYSFALAGR